MTLSLVKPEPTLAQLKSLAASGSSGLSKAAQLKLKARTTEALRRAVGRG